MKKRRKAGQVYDPNVVLLKTKLRMDEAAAMLEVHEDTIRRWLDEGKLASIRTPGGHRRVRTASVRKYL